MKLCVQLGVESLPRLPRFGTAARLDVGRGRRPPRSATAHIPSSDLNMKLVSQLVILTIVLTSFTSHVAAGPGGLHGADGLGGLGGDGHGPS